MKKLILSILFLLFSTIVTAQQLTATLNVVVVGSEPLSYQWYQGAKGVTTIPVGINSSSFTTPPLTAGQTIYWVRITNAFGTVDSEAAVINVGAAPVIVTQPQSQTIGAPTTFRLICPTSYFAPPDPGSNPPSATVLFESSTVGGTAPITKNCTPPSGTKVNNGAIVNCIANDSSVPPKTVNCSFPVTIQ